MKAVALILALAVITGCNARAVRQVDATTDRWVGTVDTFWQYIADLNQKADGVIVNIKDSQLRRELDTLITDTMAELSNYKEDIESKLTPFTETSATRMSQDFTLLVDKLQKDMIDAKERHLEYLGELKAMVETNTDNVRDRLNSYTTKLRKRLTKDTTEIKETAAIYMEEVQSRASQNLQSVREAVEPYVQQISDDGSKKLSSIATFLQTQSDVLGGQLQSQAEGLKTQLEATAQELRTSLEGKIDELTDLLTPLATKLREQMDTIVDKVTEGVSS